MNRKEAGERTVKEAFGGALYQQGRGFYVSLELFAMLRGMHEADLPLLAEEKGQPIRYRRRSHDFARRLLADPAELSAEQRSHLGSDAESTLRSLLAGLTVPIPGMRAEPAWWNRHFFPYVGELAHYDAVFRGRGTRRVSIERYTYRGGGALAYRLLRDDHDTVRLGTVRDGLRALVAPSDTQLARLAREFSKLDAEPADKRQPDLFEDSVAAETKAIDTVWAEILRDGVAGIVRRTSLTSSRRIDALMHFVPLCIAMHELACADRVLESRDARTIVVDTSPGPTPIRRLSREDLAAAVGVVYESLGVLARKNGNELLLQQSQAWREGPRTFFTTTLGAIGALNAMVGQRHFRLAPPLLEAIVLALVPGEQTLESFVEYVLFERLQFVVDGRTADRAGRVGDVDRGAFDQNAAGLATTLRELGLLREYSDATRMVGTRAL
ncbi:hypothetical protein [Sandaracinus amylolyticus]|uniref:hypothetical protein n=1 Tax=Sandaracinus amylolyticus TaxID=927083 RepID=UPI001F1A9551|nr:hypothetical protein [Sandaracinus amylolyticus]UJR83669.1 Hypothetical protein I5071_57380 [Sandaracinus amylolyticus]